MQPSDSGIGLFSESLLPKGMVAMFRLYDAPSGKAPLTSAVRALEYNGDEIPLREEKNHK